MSAALRIGLISHIGNDWMGGMLYIRNLAQGVTMCAEQDKRPVFVDIPQKRLELKAIELGKGLAARLPYLPARLFNHKNYDFLYPCLAGKRAPYDWATWIPDFQEAYLPQFFAPEVIEQRRQTYQHAADFAPAVVVSSEMAKQDFARLYPGAADRCRILRFTSFPGDDWTKGDPIQTQKEYDLPDRFFMVCNQFWMHKDHAVVFKALGILKQRGITPVVVCTGNTADARNPNYFAELTSLIESAGIDSQVRILGLIPRLAQIQLLRRSLAVIQPSLFEGWSTVVEDVRTLGKPSLLSDFPVHVEQNPTGARFFERGNAEQLADQMAKAYEELEPGPHLEAESAAVDDARRGTAEFGRTFLNIVDEVRGRTA